MNINTGELIPYDELKKLLESEDKEISDKAKREYIETQIELTEKQLKINKIGRNDLCPCGSGKKFKKCHLGKNNV
jgi:uncharacterized protein YchJ